MPKKIQKGGTSLYGPTIKAMKAQGDMGAGRGRIPHGPPTSTCNAGSPQRPSLPSTLPFIGGGLAHSKFSGAGHRPILAHPGFGYKTGENNVLFKGSRPTVSSYNAASCQGGGKKKRKKNKKKKRRKSRKRTKSLFRKKRTKRKRGYRGKSPKRTKKRKSRKRVKKRIKKNNLIGCGQKGGSSVQYGFPGPVDKSLGDYRLWKGNGLTIKNNFNCPDTYNHYTK